MAITIVTANKVIEDRWVYNMEPPNREKIRRAVVAFTKKYCFDSATAPATRCEAKERL